MSNYKPSKAKVKERIWDGDRSFFACKRIMGIDLGLGCTGHSLSVGKTIRDVGVIKVKKNNKFHHFSMWKSRMKTLISEHYPDLVIVEKVTNIHIHNGARDAHTHGAMATFIESHLYGTNVMCQFVTINEVKASILTPHIKQDVLNRPKIQANETKACMSEALRLMWGVSLPQDIVDSIGALACLIPITELKIGSKVQREYSNEK